MVPRCRGLIPRSKLEWGHSCGRVTGCVARGREYRAARQAELPVCINLQLSAAREPCCMSDARRRASARVLPPRRNSSRQPPPRGRRSDEDGDQAGGNRFHHASFARHHTRGSALRRRPDSLCRPRHSGGRLRRDGRRAGRDARRPGPRVDRLAEAGMAFGNVVVVDVFLTDVGRYGAYDEVLRAVPDRGGLDTAGPCRGGARSASRGLAGRFHARRSLGDRRVLHGQPRSWSARHPRLGPTVAAEDADMPVPTDRRGFSQSQRMDRSPRRAPWMERHRSLSDGLRDGRPCRHSSGPAAAGTSTVGAELGNSAFSQQVRNAFPLPESYIQLNPRTISSRPAFPQHGSRSGFPGGKMTTIPSR